MTGSECEGRKLDVEELLELSEGDSLEICYGSVYAENPQTLEAEVAAVDVHESQSSEVTWFDVPLDLGDREERLRSRKRETYRNHETIRKIGGTIDDTSGWIDLYALNGGRWHKISERESVAVLEESE
jgi:hypothetical protein